MKMWGQQRVGVRCIAWLDGSRCIGGELSLVDEKLAPVWIERNDEATDTGLNDVSSKRDRVIAESRALCAEVANFKRNERPGNRRGMIRVCRRDDESDITESILDPIVAHRSALALQDKIVEAARS
jgi:hypothetical protein